MRPTSRSRTGRRIGETGTRIAIADAARELFSSQGFERTTIRAVAARAGVDPALVMYFFTSKRHLFAEVLTMPADYAGALHGVLEGEAATLPERLTTFLLSVFEQPEALSRIVAAVRAAASDPAAAQLLHATLTERIYEPLSQLIEIDEPELRANLIGSTIVGLLMTRHIVTVEPLATTGTEKLHRALLPVIRRYLTNPL